MLVIKLCLAVVKIIILVYWGVGISLFIYSQCQLTETSGAALSSEERETRPFLNIHFSFTRNLQLCISFPL